MYLMSKQVESGSEVQLGSADMLIASTSSEGP
jgi:hypothetical protein